MRTKLREARKQQGVSQGSIAKLVGISLKSYQRIEKGIQEPRVSIAIPIAKAVQGTVEELFGEAAPEDVIRHNDTNK